MPVTKKSASKTPSKPKSKTQSKPKKSLSSRQKAILAAILGSGTAGVAGAGYYYTQSKPKSMYAKIADQFKPKPKTLREKIEALAKKPRDLFSSYYARANNSAKTPVGPVSRPYSPFK